MSSGHAGDVISHWYKYVEGFHTSSQDFYGAVEEAIKRREVPGLSTSRVEWKEGGVVAARREYLRISREKLVCDICAAPFGNGYFFSWWLAKPSPRLLLYAAYLLAGLFALWVFFGQILGWFWGSLATLFLMPVVLVTIGGFVRAGVLAIEDEILAVPVLGRLYNWLFRPYTYFKMDSALMFQEAMRASVEEVINDLFAAKGMRALSDLERKPVLQELVAKR